MPLLQGSSGLQPVRLHNGGSQNQRQNPAGGMGTSASPKTLSHSIEQILRKPSCLTEDWRRKKEAGTASGGAGGCKPRKYPEAGYKHKRKRKLHP
ncbi:hypothetical protein SKAU_G00025820 [Synaphobranchus kaupii]|uniref:Uncharacterized protein n=1 Tax=Synaphobranchus kaupii TaxID=118154 RepID=A0A9Q1GE24_SYNKA|nr:hypothetical protein SKAU_G00025820 [Synaphobranchus kaupii]